MLTADQLSALSGVVLSLVLSYVPGLSDLYGSLDATEKRLVMAVLLVSVAVGALGLSCSDIIAAVECSKIGLVSLVDAFLAALVANQAAYLISPKPKADLPAQPRVVSK